MPIRPSGSLPLPTWSCSVRICLNTHFAPWVGKCLCQDAFDPLEADKYRGLLAEAEALADVLGAGASDPKARDGQSSAVCIVSDTGHEKFGTDVPLVVLDSSPTFV